MDMMIPELRFFAVYLNDSPNFRQDSSPARPSPRAGVLATQFFEGVKNFFSRALEGLQSVPKRILSVFACGSVSSGDMDESSNAPTDTVRNHDMSSSTQNPAAVLLDSGSEEVIDFTQLEVRDFPRPESTSRVDIDEDKPVLLGYKNCHFPHCTPEPLLKENGFEFPPAGDYCKDEALEVVMSEQDMIIRANDPKDSSTSNRSSTFLEQKVQSLSRRNKGRVL